MSTPAISLGGGRTPLCEYPDHPLARKMGLRLQVKDEGKAEPGYGANPTQSFKDRGMAPAVSMARRFGLSRLAVPTQGNAGDSLVEYALAAGFEVAVMPRRPACSRFSRHWPLAASFMSLGGRRRPRPAKRSRSEMPGH